MSTLIYTDSFSRSELPALFRGVIHRGTKCASLNLLLGNCQMLSFEGTLKSLPVC